jgi:hypothetical protein
MGSRETTVDNVNRFCRRFHGSCSYFIKTTSLRMWLHASASSRQPRSEDRKTWALHLIGLVEASKYSVSSVISVVKF